MCDAGRIGSRLSRWLFASAKIRSMRKIRSECVCVCVCVCVDEDANGDEYEDEGRMSPVLTVQQALRPAVETKNGVGQSIKRGKCVQKEHGCCKIN